ncbi:hypothetical protein DSO57_1012826 [Entomophthora muscae]|uniref:Uncharacterized protein n=1 Tax=Entomophthora muscae TaxID=34485 RepID=A0ACC2RKT1_9FUNG|nr:hypothetical protein DSO57_1012826 [Entomophthora muscae]
MRLRGSISNAALIYNVSSTLDKFGRNILVKFLPESLQLILQSSLDAGMQVYSSIPVKKIFSEYLLEPSEGDGIYIELEAELLTRSLKSSSDSITKFRATRKDDVAYLKFSTTHRSRNKAEVTLSQDIPIRILTLDQIGVVNDFELPTPDIQFRLPAIEQLRSEMARIAKFSTKVLVAANLKGLFYLQAISLEANIKVTFDHTTELNFNVLPEEFYTNSIKYQNRDRSLPAKIRVLMKDLKNCFSSPVVTQRTTVCGIIENHMLTICCLLVSPLGDSMGRVTFCFPCNYDDDQV